jgi:protein TonB
MSIETTKVDFSYRPPVPPYPPLARMARIQGVVRVEVLAGADGVPQSAKAVDGPYQLRAAAEAYAMTWRVRPPAVNGIPRPSRFEVSITYRITN